MSDVKRFDCTSGGAQYCYGCYTMTRDDEYGDYVLFEDYDALRARLAAAESRLREYEDAPVVAWLCVNEDLGLTDATSRAEVRNSYAGMKRTITELIIRPRGGKGE